MWWGVWWWWWEESWGKLCSGQQTAQTAAGGFYLTAGIGGNSDLPLSPFPWAGIHPCMVPAKGALLCLVFGAGQRTKPLPQAGGV